MQYPEKYRKKMLLRVLVEEASGRARLLVFFFWEVKERTMKRVLASIVEETGIYRQQGRTTREM